MAGVFEVTAWWLALLALWIASLTTVTWQELVIAALCAGPCAFVARKTREVLGVRWARVPLRGVAALPRAAVAETVQVWGRALRRRGDGDVREVEAGNVGLLSAVPGTVVIDERESTVVVHAFGEPGAVERAVRR
jgi:hypothetical protein